VGLIYGSGASLHTDSMRHTRIAQRLSKPSMSAEFRTLLLCSGGVESAVLIAQAQAAEETPVPLFADYSQRGAAMERQAADNICRALGSAPPQLLDLQHEGRAFQAINRLHIPLPHRNLILLSLALAWASQHGCSKLALGLNRDDFGKDAQFQSQGAVRYETGTLAFVDRFRALAEAVAPDVEVALPQESMAKAQVVQLGAKLRVPLELSYSCMRGRERHCGACLQCRARREAFLAAGVAEAEGFYEA